MSTEQRQTVLIVDDDELVRASIGQFLKAKGYLPSEAHDIRSAVAAVTARPPQLALLDEGLPDGSGLDLMRRLRELQPDLGVVVLTGNGTIDLAVQAIKEGAQHFLTKPVDMHALVVVFERIVESQRGQRRRLADERREGREAIDPFMGRSDAIKRLADDAQRLLGVERPVLIQGETGAGKGVLAKWLHERGPRHDETFVDLNCAALSRDLLESELFGHEAGAFTGALKRKQGLLEVAHRGTAFLDEIGDMDIAIQPRLLKIIEERRMRRVGDVRDRFVDCALIAATHQDLRRLMAERRFREDLYFRINAFPVHVPALRARGEDIPILAHHFVSRFAAERGRGDVPFSKDAQSALGSYPWPGNVRELRNVVERAVIVCAHDVIQPADLALSPSSSVAHGDAATGDWPTLAELERRHIAATLEQEGGRVAPAAKRLGISVSSLYERLKRLGPGSTVPGEPSGN